MSGGRATNAPSPGKQILLGIVATGVGLFLAAAPAYNGFLAYGMKSWKTTTAYVTRIRPGELWAGGRAAALRGELSSVLTLRYTAGGQSLTTEETVAHPAMAGPRLINDHGHVENVYVGKRVRCYYNPARPEWARLSAPTNEWWYWLPAAGAGAVGLLSFGAGIVGYRRRRRDSALAPGTDEIETEFLH